MVQVKISVLTDREVFEWQEWQLFGESSRNLFPRKMFHWPADSFALESGRAFLLYRLRKWTTYARKSLQRFWKYLFKILCGIIDTQAIHTTNKIYYGLECAAIAYRWRQNSHLTRHVVTSSRFIHSTHVQPNKISLFVKDWANVQRMWSFLFFWLG